MVLDVQAPKVEKIRSLPRGIRKSPGLVRIPLYIYHLHLKDLFLSANVVVTLLCLSLIEVLWPTEKFGIFSGMTRNHQVPDLGIQLPLEVSD